MYNFLIFITHVACEKQKYIKTISNTFKHVPQQMHKSLGKIYCSRPTNLADELMKLTESE